MSRSITSKTNLRSLRKEAKRWLKALREGEAEARDRYAAVYPRGPATATLREVQQALAREHGFASWAALKTRLEDEAIAARSDAERAAELLELASLHYGVAPGSGSYSGAADGPESRRRAARILSRHPEVARHSLHTAVVSGDLDEVTRRLAARPEAAREKGGREGWTPLLYLAYGRLPSAAAAENALAIATALLDHGADPNDAWTYETDGQEMAFSALCGAIGDGERGPVLCPPHPRAEALAALLLDRGADPNQSQALYNTMLRGDDDRWLRTLIARGLGPQHAVLWQPAGKQSSLFEYLLAHAVTNNQLARAAVLLENGAPATPTDGRSLYERALLGGNMQMAELLARHGAARTVLAGREAFRAACARLDRATAARLLAEDPSFAIDARHLLAGDVAAGDLVDVARLLLDLGVSPDAALGGRRALHLAACAGAVAVTELLIQRGADVDARDVSYRATPLAWAMHVHLDATIELLARHSRDVFTLVAGGFAERLRAILEESPAAANARAPERLGLGRTGADPGETPIFVLPGDEDAAIEVAEVLLGFGAEREARNRAGETPAEKARARGLLAVADWLQTDS